MGLSAVLGSIRSVITSAINDAGITQAGQVIVGWPTAPQFVEIIGQPKKEWQITLYPMPARNATRYIAEGGSYAPPTVMLTRSIAGATLTFGGSIPAQYGALNVHSFLAELNEDIYIRAQPSQSLDDVATAVAVAVNALAIPGVSALATGAAVALTGATWQFCNIGGTGSITRGEELRTSRIVQVSIWTPGGTVDANPDNPLRLAIYDAIMQRLGGVSRHFLTLPDTSSAYVAFAGDAFDDDSQSSYSTYVAHIKYDVEYGIFLSQPATQVGDIAATTSVDGQASITRIGGSP